MVIQQKWKKIPPKKLEGLIIYFELCCFFVQLVLIMGNPVLAALVDCC